jgi:hypothetical protein
VDQKTQTDLRFTVRAPFVVHRVRLVDRANGRGKDQRVDSFHASEAVALRADEVRLHAHALEPTDGPSRAALEALHFTAPAVSAIAGAPPDPALQALVTQIVSHAVCATVAALAPQLKLPPAP